MSADDMEQPPLSASTSPNGHRRRSVHLRRRFVAGPISASGNRVSRGGRLDPDARAKEVGPGVALFQTYVQKFHLGFEIKPVNDVTLPAYASPVRMTAAHQERR